MVKIATLAKPETVKLFIFLADFADFAMIHL
jgi:hypothetical protein